MVQDGSEMAEGYKKPARAEDAGETKGDRPEEAEIARCAISFKGRRGLPIPVSL